MWKLFKRDQNNYYSWKPLLEQYPDAKYYMALSERRNGKTYAALDLMLQEYFKTGKKGVLLRRFKTDFVGQMGDEMIEGLTRDGLVEKYSHGEYAGIYHSGTRFYLYKNVEKEVKNGPSKTIREICRDPWLYGIGIDDMEHGKGSTGDGDRFSYILFDEFISKRFYLTDEFVLFQNCLATLLSGKSGVKILMAGNTVSKIACPYFQEMGLDRVKEQPQGTVDVYHYGTTDLEVVVEYAKPRNKSKAYNEYFAFNNPKLKMITNGDWEVSVHPHLQERYFQSDKIFDFFVLFDGETMHCEVVQKKDIFIFVHPKTTDLEHPDKDLIYSDQYAPFPNWRRSIFYDTLPISKKICEMMSNGRVYFSDNSTGELWDHYIDWAHKNK